MFKTFRNVLALVYMVCFMAWLAIVCFYLVPLIVNMPEGIDPMMALIAGLGIGAVTQFFVIIGTLIYQFYFRKAGTDGLAQG